MKHVARKRFASVARIDFDGCGKESHFFIRNKNSYYVSLQR